MRIVSASGSSSPQTLGDYLDLWIDIVDRTSLTRLRQAVGRRGAMSLDGFVTARIQEADPKPEDLYLLARGYWSAIERALRAVGFRLEDTPESRAAVEGDMELFRRTVREALQWLLPHHAISSERNRLLSERFESQEDRETWQKSRRKTPDQARDPASPRGLTLSPDHPAVREHRGVYPKTLALPDQRSNIFMPGAHNIKLGGVVRSGEMKKLPIFQLTLEERATCPPCVHRLDCYGNNMPFTRRIDTGALSTSEFHAWIERSVEEHVVTFPRGILYRLHALGDFVPDRDVDNDAYARFWLGLLGRYPTVRVFGYTHVPYDSPVGLAIREMNDTYPDRSFIRFSNQPRATEFATVSLKRRPDTDTVEASGRQVTVCPAQLADTKCAKCALCFSQRVGGTIGFITHASL